MTKIVMLGTGTPNADPNRSGSAIAIIVNDVSYLIDCGPGIVRRAISAYNLGIEALKANKLKKLFVTHLHSDHTLGLADLIFTPWVLGRNQVLDVYGPSGITEMSEHLIAAYKQDIKARQEGLEPANDIGYKVNAHEIKPGIIYQDANISVEAFLVKHGTWKEAYGYVFNTPDKKIVISGDTVPLDIVVEKSKGCDVLIHEVYSAKQFEKKEPNWQKYHASAHTSTIELAELAKRAKPKLLVLYHQLFWGTTEDELLLEIKDHYNGEVVSAKDLDQF